MVEAEIAKILARYGFYELRLTVDRVKVRVEYVEELFKIVKKIIESR